MNVEQLRYLCCIAAEGFSVSAAARRLGTSQPAVSQKVRALEKTLGVELLVRHGNRLLGFTAAGQSVHATALNMVRDADNLLRIAAEFKQRGSGRLVVAATHINARYVLGPVIKEFRRSTPAVDFEVWQGTPAQIAEWVTSGAADMGIGTQPKQVRENLVYLRCAELPRILIAPPGHAILREKKLTLAAIARHPFIAMDPIFAGGSTVRKTFEDAGLAPKTLLTAIDPDVIKWYVELGLGLAVMPAVSYDRARDQGLRALDASHLFEATVTHIELLRGRYLTSHMLHMITLLAPKLSREDVLRAMVA
ncbi:MAG: cysB [Betaproteobacteria bacterium]|nr:cysB [Betaproteobacteria bacterium]